MSFAQLAGQPGPRVCDALERTLFDAHFEVRYRSGIAILRLVTKHPELTVDEETILHAVRFETQFDRDVFFGQSLTDSAHDDPSPLHDRLEAGPPAHAVTHAFTLLATVLEPEPLLLAYSALAGPSEELRGTALEYLDLVLPADIRDRLWPYLTDSPRDMRTRGTRAPLVEQLRTGRGSLTTEASPSGPDPPR